MTVEYVGKLKVDGVEVVRVYGTNLDFVYNELGSYGAKYFGEMNTKITFEVKKHDR